MTTDPRPTDLLFGKKSNDYNIISATDRPIYFIFGSRVGFLESADRMALFPVRSNPIWRPSLCNDFLILLLRRVLSA